MKPQGEGLPCISTSDIGRIIGVNVSVAFLEGIGVMPHYKTAQGAYWLESELPIICRMIAMRLEVVSAELAYKMMRANR